MLQAFGSHSVEVSLTLELNSSEGTKKEKKGRKDGRAKGRREGKERKHNMINDVN